MPSTTILEIPPAEQGQMRAILRRARDGSLLAFHVLLRCAASRTPTEIAAYLLCSRSSVYRIVRAYRTGSLGIRIAHDGQLSIAVQSTILMPWLTRSLGAIRKKAPHAYGWCRTRWSCATLAMTLQAKPGIAVSAATVRRWLHEIGWVWKRAKLAAKDDDPQRAFGDVHDTCTRNHQRKRRRDLVQDVERHVQENGPWQDKLSRLYEAPEVTAVVERIAAEKQPKVAA